MKTVHFLTIRDRITNFAIYPIKYNQHRLREAGYACHFFYKISATCLHCNILCINSKYFRSHWHNPEAIFSFFRTARKYTDKIIWFDDSDSTGVTHFEILPEVDLYLKKQLLKDKRLYTRPLYGDRIFTNFYHEEFKIDDDVSFQSQPLDLSLAHKVGLSWHIGLGDMINDSMPRVFRRIKSYLPPRYPRRFTPIDKSRPLDVMFRGSRKYSRNTVKFHRERIGEILDAMDHLNAALVGFVSIPRYKQEMKDAKIVVSPFGWGEIGVRDFEAWIYGAVLMKPDMSHMETWPDVFLPHETYFPIQWNFENLETDINTLLENPRLREELAENGRSAYAAMVSPTGMNQFCEWFIQQIEQ